MDEIGRTARHALGESRRCMGTNNNGQRCGRWAIPGGYVCANHGGKAPATIAAAKQRLATFIDPALSAIIRALEGGPPCEVCGRSDDDLDPTRIKAAIAVLDRAGLPPLMRLQHSAPGYGEPDEELAGLTLPELLARTRELEGKIEELMRDDGIPTLHLVEPAIDVQPVPASPDDEPETEVV